MKKLLTTLFAISGLFVAAQTPQGINYQSIIRNTGGVVLPNTAVNVEFKLYSGLAPTTLLYNETHSATTNSFGMVNLVIGQGNVLGGVVTFNNIPWVSGIQYEVWVNSSQVGTRQPFMSVPYALHAQTASAAPAPNVTFTNNILSVGGNTVSITTGTTYTAGAGIAISGNTITNNAPDQTVTLTGLGSATVTGGYPNFTVETPVVTVATPPTIIGTGATTVTSSGNTFTVNSPAPFFYTAGTDISVTSGSVINNTAPDKTVTINAAGAATVTGAYPNFTLNVPNGTALPNGYSGQLLFNDGTKWDTIPRDNLYFDGTNFGIGTQAPQMTFHVVGAGRFDASVTTNQIYTNNFQMTPGTSGQVLTSDNSGNGTWQSPSSYSLTQSGSNINLTENGTAIATVTLTAATSTSLSAGNSNIVLNQSGNAYTITPVTPTFTNSGPTTIAGTYPNYTVNSVATPSTTLVQGNNVTLNQTGNTYTVSSVTPTLNVNGGSLTGAYPTQTLTIPPSNPSTTITAGTNITVLGSAPNYLISSPSQSLTVNTNSLSISGGNTVIIPTSTVLAGTHITVAPSGNTYSVSAVTPTLNVSGGTLSGSYPNQTLTIPTNSTTIVNAGTNISVAGTAPNYTVSATAPPLALSGNTLTSGPATNSVSLAGFNGIYGGSGSLTTGSTTVTVGTNTLTFLSGATANKPIANFFGSGISGTHLTVGHLSTNPASIKFLGSVSSAAVDYGYVSGNANGINISGGTSSNGLFVSNSAEVGIGTFITGIGKFVMTHAATAAVPTMHLRETNATGLTRMKFSNTNVANSFFEIATDIKGIFNNSALSINVNDGSNIYNPVLLVGGGRQVYVNALNTPLASFHVMENAGTANGGIISEGFAQPGQIIIARNNQTATLRTAVMGGNELGKLLFAGFNGTTYNNSSAKITANATENYTGSNIGAEMVFSTVPNGSNASQEVLRLMNDGRVEVKNGLFIPYGGPTAGKVLTSDAAGNASWQMPSVPASPWVQGPGVVSLSSPADWVGIGTNSPNSPFQVLNYVSFENNGSNTSLGYNTGTGTSSGGQYSNTFVGAFAGQAVGSSPSNSNSFFGYNSGMNNTVGNNNTFAGAASGRLTTTGSNNVFLGTSSGQSNTTGSANAFVGQNSGINNTTGISNTFLGTSTGLSSTIQYTNATAIGYNTRVNDNDMIALGNNSDVVIGGPKAGLIAGATRYLSVINNGTYSVTTITSLELAGNTNGGGAVASKIDFINTNTNIARIEAITSSGSTTQGALRFFTNGGTLGEAMRITETARVGIGMTTPGGLLELGLDQGRKPGTTVWTVTSDERLKTIEGSYTKGLKEILQLQPIAYHYKNVGERKFNDEVTKTLYAGFSAQQVQQVFPEAVGVDEDGYLNLNIHAILIAYTNAVKELNAKAENQQKTIEEQKKTIEDLQLKYDERLKRLEAALETKTQK